MPLLFYVFPPDEARARRDFSIIPDMMRNHSAALRRVFVEGQEAVGIRIIGQYRDLDDPDRFVWMRSFADMEPGRWD